MSHEDYKQYREAIEKIRILKEALENVVKSDDLSSAQCHAKQALDRLAEG